MWRVRSFFLGGHSPVCDRLCVFPLARDQPNDIVDRHIRGALRHHDFGEHAFFDCFDFHGRLVGLDLSDHIARLDFIALFLQPAGKIAFFHGRRKRGHENVDRHGKAHLFGAQR